MTLQDSEQWIGKTIWDETVPTPFVFVDLEILRRNIDHMAALTKEAGVALRPHTKTHKIAAIARMQLQAGANGLTVAKLGEAKAFFDAGIATSYMVAQPFVGAEKVRWLLRLTEGNEVLVCADDVGLAESMGFVAHQGGKMIDLILMVDTGYGRFGVDWRRAGEVAEQMARLSGIRFRGIRSHDGRTYTTDDVERQTKIAREEAERMVEVAESIRRRGVPCDIVSVGSTPGAHRLLKNGEVDGITEVRPGNYVFYDRMQVSLKVARPEDCALRVIASVTAVPEMGRALIDAGLKTLTGTTDRFSEGYGLLLNRPDALLERLWEECGLVRYRGEPFRVGDRLVIIPNHSCEITNLADVVFYGANDRIGGLWVPEARGKVW